MSVPRKLWGYKLDVVMCLSGGEEMGVGMGVCAFFHRRILLRASRLSHWTSASPMLVRQIRPRGVDTSLWSKVDWDMIGSSRCAGSGVSNDILYSQHANYRFSRIRLVHARGNDNMIRHTQGLSKKCGRRTGISELSRMIIGSYVEAFQDTLSQAQIYVALYLP
jgi:hypothetical protein